MNWLRELWKRRRRHYYAVEVLLEWHDIQLWDGREFRPLTYHQRVGGPTPRFFIPVFDNPRAARDFAQEEHRVLAFRSSEWEVAEARQEKEIRPRANRRRKPLGRGR